MRRSLLKLGSGRHYDISSAIMDGSESAGRIDGDGDLRVGVPRTLSGGSLSRTPADVTGLCELGAVPEMTRAIVMTLDDRRPFSEHFSRVPTPRMAVGDEGIVKMVDGPTDDCRTHSPAAITTETNTTTTGKGTIQTRAEGPSPSRVPLSFSVESIMAGTVRRCSRPVDNTLHTANPVDDLTTTRFSVDNILSPVCVNRTSPLSLSPGRCRFTGVALTSQVPTVKLTSGVNSAWMPAGPDYSTRQGTNYGVSVSVRVCVCACATA